MLVMKHPDSHLKMPLLSHYLLFPILHWQQKCILESEVEISYLAYNYRMNSPEQEINLVCSDDFRNISLNLDNFKFN